MAERLSQLSYLDGSHASASSDQEPSIVLEEDLTPEFFTSISQLIVENGGQEEKIPRQVTKFAEGTCIQFHSTRGPVWVVIDEKRGKEASNELYAVKADKQEKGRPTTWEAVGDGARVFKLRNHDHEWRITAGKKFYATVKQAIETEEFIE